MSDDLAFNPDKWYYDGPEENLPPDRQKIASPHIMNTAEELARKAFGEEGVKKLLTLN
jgi:hypothetical protein